MPRTLIALLLLVGPVSVALAADTPQLLVNAQRLRRLKRDRERKTTRWVNFENRVNNVPDSPERGFELALYYLVSGDEARGREAVDWAVQHRQARTSALVLDWCAPLLSDTDRQKLSAEPTGAAEHFAALRDRFLLQLASGSKPERPTDEVLRREIGWFIREGFRDSRQVYAFSELTIAARAALRVDLRESEPSFFRVLPEQLILAERPQDLDRGDWNAHIAALALVAVDPNLPSSQFLQSWAMEEKQSITEGSGVAYELLWADPYLPGVGYQNMQNFLFDDHGRLFARASWDTNACWIEISPQGVSEQNCPANWRQQTVVFGHLTLIPMEGKCLEISPVPPNDTQAVWKLKPGQKMTFGKGKDQGTGTADEAGIWRVSGNVEGKVCLATH